MKKSEENDVTRLKHIYEAAEKARYYASGKKRTDLDEDELLMLALTRLVEIIGEASNYLSDAFRDNNPTIPWTSIIRMRNQLIHAYFRVDADVLWNTIQSDLPILMTAIAPYIGKSKNAEAQE
jgi:uncharacterized protein with HEPN domain